MVDYAAEIEVRLDSEAECEEIMKYDEVQDYQPTVPTTKEWQKQWKVLSGKGQKKFQLMDGVLHYKEVLKLKTGQLWLRQVT